jgi:hypothetical protein
MRWRLVSVTACSAALVAARAAGTLRTDLIAEVNADHVPDELQEELLAGVNELVARLPCPGRVQRAAASVARELARRVRAASG